MYAIPRKKRKSKAIEKSSKLFSKFMNDKDYENASKVLFWCVLKDFAKEGILNALEHANSFIERKKYWRGL